MNIWKPLLVLGGLILLIMVSVLEFSLAPHACTPLSTNYNSSVASSPRHLDSLDTYPTLCKYVPTGAIPSLRNNTQSSLDKGSDETIDCQADFDIREEDDEPIILDTTEQLSLDNATALDTDKQLKINYNFIFPRPENSEHNCTMEYLDKTFNHLNTNMNQLNELPEGIFLNYDLRLDGGVDDTAINRINAYISMIKSFEDKLKTCLTGPVEESINSTAKVINTVRLQSNIDLYKLIKKASQSGRNQHLYLIQSYIDIFAFTYDALYECCDDKVETYEEEKRLKEKCKERRKLQKSSNMTAILSQEDEY